MHLKLYYDSIAVRNQLQKQKLWGILPRQKGPQPPRTHFLAAVAINFRIISDYMSIPKFVTLLRVLLLAGNLVFLRQNCFNFLTKLNS